MPSTKRLVRQERRASYNYFRDSIKKKDYDEATVVLFEHPEITDYLSKKELRLILTYFREDYLQTLSDMCQGTSGLEKAAENIGKKIQEAMKKIIKNE